MPKSHEEIADKAREIFKKARTSRVPITIVCTQAVALFDLEKWELEDIEQVSGDVIHMLMLHGWKNR